jgi:hypothetical protein
MDGGLVGKVFFTLVLLVVIYYVYQWLFGSNGFEGKQILNSVVSANPETGHVLQKSEFPTLLEGGEYSMNMWLYINDYSVNRGQNKHLLTLGGNTFATLLVYLGAYEPSLKVRVHTGTQPAGGSGSSAASTVDLRSSLIKSIFTPTAVVPGVTENKPCDISSVDLQRWVQVTITLNGKIVDVYIDGKLARSCILPSNYKVDGQNLFMTVNDYKGFGGFISNISAYNYSLNPEQVWRLYMTGPGQQYSLFQYFSAMFNPATDASYPKQQVLG